MSLAEETPDHSSLTVICDRLPLEVHGAVFDWGLTLARVKTLLKGQTVGVDSTTLEANAAMKSIVRKDTGEGWREYVTGLMRESGITPPQAIPPLHHRPVAGWLHVAVRFHAGP